MTDHPSEDDKREDADAEFQRVLGNLVNMPHKPHKPQEKGREPKLAPNGLKDSEGVPTNCSAPRRQAPS